MPKIDIEKLRRFHADAMDAFAAMRRAAEVRDDARKDVSHARAQLEAVREPVPGVKRDDAAREKPMLVALEVEEASYVRAEAEYDRQHDAWTHASRIWTRCRDYAAANGALPDDLRT